MEEQFKSVSVDEVVASAANGVLRAFEARRIGLERVSLPQLVRSGFNVRFEIWCGGPWLRALEEGLNPQPLPPLETGGLAQAAEAGQG